MSDVRKPVVRRVIRIVGLAVLTYAAWCVAVYFAQNRLIFPGASVAGGGANFSPGDGEEVVTLTAADGTITRGILYVPRVVRNASAMKDGGSTKLPLAVLLHGNDEFATSLRGTVMAQTYVNRGMAVLYAEYRGYAGTGSSLSQKAITDGLVELVEHVGKDARIDPSRMVYHGRSLGGGFACDLALRVPPRAVVLECTFTSIASFAARYGVPGFVCSSPLRNDEALPRISAAVLIFHGAQDTIVPVSHGRELARIKPEAKYVETAGGHFDYPTDVDGYEAAIAELLKGAGVLPSPTK